MRIQLYCSAKTTQVTTYANVEEAIILKIQGSFDKGNGISQQIRDKKKVEPVDIERGMSAKSYPRFKDTKNTTMDRKYEKEYEIFVNNRETLKDN